MARTRHHSCNAHRLLLSSNLYIAHHLCTQLILFTVVSIKSVGKKMVSQRWCLRKYEKHADPLDLSDSRSATLSAHRNCVHGSRPRLVRPRCGHGNPHQLPMPFARTSSERGDSPRLRCARSCPPIQMVPASCRTAISHIGRTSRVDDMILAIARILPRHNGELRCARVSPRT